MLYPNISILRDWAIPIGQRILINQHLKYNIRCLKYWYIQSLMPYQQ